MPPAPATPCPPELQRLRERYQRERDALCAHLLQPGLGTRSVRAVLRRLCQLSDRMLRSLARSTRLPAQVALLAVGGYGRGQLFPYSDVDVLLLLPGDGRTDAAPQDVSVTTPDASDAPGSSEHAHAGAVQDFIGACWDVGLVLASSVRTPAQCLAQSRTDLSLQTALLDARLITGSAALFAQLRTQFAEQLCPQRFFIDKMHEMRQRHARFAHTPYALEPDCKQSPGALRDLHTIGWVAAAAGLDGGNPPPLAASCAAPRGAAGQTRRRSAGPWATLAQCGMATALEVRQLEQHEAVLTLMRARLHAISGRCEDRLHFDRQPQLAAAFGLRPHTAAGQRTPVPASQALMRRYYWSAKAISQLRQILLLNMQQHLFAPPPPRALPEAVAAELDAMPTPGQRTGCTSAQCEASPRTTAPPLSALFCLRGDLLDVADEAIYQRHPRAILLTFWLLQRTPGLRGLSARVLRALFGARASMDRRFRQDAANHAAFLRILAQPTGVTRALRLMNDTSVLGRYLWAFRRIVGRMQHDLLHVYTVDQHTLMVLRHMRSFFRAAAADGNRDAADEAAPAPHTPAIPALCLQLARQWAESDQPWLLYLAALFHDIGKGRGGDHSTIGAIEVRRFARQHRLSQPDAQLVEFLVREHLRMSIVAQKQDTGNPAIIRAFADCVGTPRRLAALYLLTVADICGTNARLWNAWKAKLLHDLYYATLHMLTTAPSAVADTASAPVPVPVLDPSCLPLPAEVAALVHERQQHARALLDGPSIGPQTQDATGGADGPPPGQGPSHPAHALWGGLRPDYFLGHDAANLAWHVQALHPHLHCPPPLVRARASLGGLGVQVLVYAHDRSDLFARICAYFDRAGWGVWQARIHTTAQARALDSFELAPGGPWLDAHGHLRPDAAAAIERELPLAITATATLPAPRLQRPSRRARSFPATARAGFSLLHTGTEAASTARLWQLDIAASDRAGLLYAVARVLSAHGLSVQLAKISTMGERVEDSFVLQGAALSVAAQRQRIERELLQVLQGGAAAVAVPAATAQRP